MDRYRVIVSAIMPEIDENAEIEEQEGNIEDAEIQYKARVLEIPGCEAVAATRQEALDALEEELSAQIENIEDKGHKVPLPIDERDVDGTISAKISFPLHRELMAMAIDAGVEIEQLVVEILTRAATYGGRRSGGRRDNNRQSNNRRQGGRGRRGPSGDRYHNIMENRADFIDYVRKLDDGNGGGRGRGRGRR